MKKIFKSRLFFFILGVLIFGISTVFALDYMASQIGYTPSDTSWNVNNSGAALDSLYSSQKNTIDALRSELNKYDSSEIYGITTTGSQTNSYQEGKNTVSLGVSSNYYYFCSYYSRTNSATNLNYNVGGAIPVIPNTAYSTYHTYLRLIVGIYKTTASTISFSGAVTNGNGANCIRLNGPSEAVYSKM
ncbi:MAG: hypothetical protein IKP79_00580, partial [Bacilli bacterium]|nr:hypothetical protein [Bacilli bacterium]